MMMMMDALLSCMIRNPRQPDHNHLPVPEWGQDVGVAVGEADRLYGQLEGDGGDDVGGEHVQQGQVPVLVPVQQAVVTRYQTWGVVQY